LYLFRLPQSDGLPQRVAFGSRDKTRKVWDAVINPEVLTLE
jgi:hypothetical protein